MIIGLGPEIDDLDDEYNTDTTASFPGIDDGLLEPNYKKTPEAHEGNLVILHLHILTLRENQRSKTISTPQHVWFSPTPHVLVWSIIL